MAIEKPASFEIKIPPTRKFNVWLATTGGHCNHVLVVWKPPTNWTPQQRNYDSTELEVPDDSLRIDLETFLTWFCDDNPGKLIELGLLEVRQNGETGPLSTKVEKWVKAEITLPYQDMTATSYGVTQSWTSVFGLDLNDQWG